MISFVFERTYPIQRAVLFALHESPSLLTRLQDARDFRIVSHDGHLRPGAHVTVKRRLGPFWLTFVFEQMIYEPPARFGEVMVRGPFRSFRHVHEFEEAAGGASTLVRDRLEFSLPWWMGGAIGERFAAGPRMKAMFVHRQEALARLVAQSAPQAEIRRPPAG